MFNSLKKIFNSSAENTDNDNSKEELSLLCGLMIESALSDGKIEKVELDKITISLVEVFKENKTEVESTINDCLEEIDTPKSLHYFTSKINKLFSENKKILLIETLWEIVLSDGNIHDYESNLIRRLAGLLYITDISCGNAKKRALRKINQKLQNDI